MFWFQYALTIYFIFDSFELDIEDQVLWISCWIILNEHLRKRNYVEVTTWLFWVCFLLILFVFVFGIVVVVIVVTVVVVVVVVVECWVGFEDVWKVIFRSDTVEVEVVDVL